MLAASGRPSGDLVAWVAETKLDGWRVQLTIGDTVSVRTRNDHPIDQYLPELRPLQAVGCPLVLDGELVAGAGRCDDFYGITGQLTARTNRPALTFVAFDLLWLDGYDLTGLPYEDRRRFLVDLELPTPAVVVNQYDAGDLDEVLAACETHGVEGVMLKRRDSAYRPGERCDTWRKVKCPSWRAHAERRRIGRWSDPALSVPGSTASMGRRGRKARPHGLSEPWRWPGGHERVGRLRWQE